MRSRTFRCRVGAAAPILSTAEYRTVRDLMVPVIPGDAVRHSVPAYVPVAGHYVNPPGTAERGRFGVFLATFMLIVAFASVCAGSYLIYRFAFMPTPDGTPPSWSTPTTYGPPPTGGVR
jgi:hypothetical protein